MWENGLRLRQRFASTFQSIDQIKPADREAAILVLPVIFLTATANGEVSENFITLYAQARNRLELNADEIEEIEKMSDEENLEALIHERIRRVQSSIAKSQLLDVAVTAAAASRLKFNAKQHSCLVRLSDTLGLHYSQQQLQQKIDWLRDYLVDTI